VYFLFEYYCAGVPGTALQWIQVQRDQPLQPDDLLQDPRQDKLPHRLLVTFRLLQGNKLEIKISNSFVTLPTYSILYTGERAENGILCIYCSTQSVILRGWIMDVLLYQMPHVSFSEFLLVQIDSIDKIFTRKAVW
jgi:hypothetical protein